MALSEHDKIKLSAEQQAQIQALTDEYTKLYNEQKAARERGEIGLVDSLAAQMDGLHDQAESIRSSAAGGGYSGGDDGTAYIEIPKTTAVKEPVSANTKKTYTVYTGTGALSKAGSAQNKTENAAAGTPSVNTGKSNPDAVMTQEDQARVQQFRDIYNSTDDPIVKKAAHEAVEDIRAGYGYSGGVDGSQYITEGVHKPAGTYMDEPLTAESQRVVDDALLNYYIAHFNEDEEDMEYWHDVAENEREKYGYSGGADGSEYIELESVSGKPVMVPGKETVETNTPKQETVVVPSVPKQETVVVPEAVEPQPVVPEIILPEIPTFSTLEAPDLGAVKMPAAPDPDAYGLPAAPEFDALSVPAAPDVQISDFSRYIEEMQNAQNEAALAEYEAAYRKNVNALERAGSGVEEAYRSARNQTAGAADLAKRNFAEMASASGLSSGSGGQAALARSVSMQNDLNTLSMEQAQTVADLEQQIADNEAWYNGAISEAKAEGDQQTAQLLYQEKIRVESETVAAIQQKFANEITVYQQQMDAKQQKFANEVTAYQTQMNARQQQFANEVSQYQMQMEAQQQQFENEISKKQLEYQELRNSVADAQWQAEFDLAYDQWLKDVQVQREQMDFQREQWEKSVEVQQKQMDTAYEQWLQSVATEQAQMEFERKQWEQSVDAQREQLDMQQKSLQAELEQMKVDNSQWQQEFDAANDQWQQEFDAANDQWLRNFNASMQEYLVGLTADQRESLADYGTAYLKAGVMPSAEMLEAMGITMTDAQKFIDEVNGVPQAASAIPTDVRTMLVKNFPNGVIRDGSWAELVKRYSEDALYAAGFTSETGNSALSLAEQLRRSGSSASDIYTRLKAKGYGESVINAVMAKLGL